MLCPYNFAASEIHLYRRNIGAISDGVIENSSHYAP